MVDAGFETQSPVSLWWSADGLTMIPVSTANPLPTTGGGGSGGGAITAPIGQTTDALSVAVTLSTDQTDIYSGTEALKVAIINPADGTPLGYNTPTNVVGPTAVGSAAANPPILVAGTADATGTGNIQVLKVSSGGVVSANTAQVNGVTTLTGTGATGTGSQRVTVAVDSATIAGTASAVGHGTAAAALRVELPTDGTGVVGLAAGTAVIGHVIADSGSTTAVTGNVTVVGSAASLATASGNPVQIGVRASVSSTPPTAATDGQIIYAQATETGKSVVKPYSVKESCWTGAANTTGTGAQTLASAGATGIKTYITSLQIGRTDTATTSLICTLNDSATSIVVVPGAGGATNIVFPVPLATTAATAFTVTPGTGVTTLYITAQGYYGL